MSKVDFDRPVEAYHEDGRVMEITCVHPWGNEQWPRCGVADGEHIFMGALGVSRSTYGDMSGWAVRNVAEPKDDVPEWAVRRANELFAAELDCGPLAGRNRTAFARYIAIHEPAPIDPDLLEARQIEYEICAAQDIHDPEQALRGEWDDREGLKGVLRAIKRGRILERGEGK